MGTLRGAITRWGERKAVAASASASEASGLRDAGHGYTTQGETAWVGDELKRLGFDQAEVEEAMERISAAANEALMAGQELSAIVSGVWFDGLMTSAEALFPKGGSDARQVDGGL